MNIAKNITARLLTRALNGHSVTFVI